MSEIKDWTRKISEIIEQNPETEERSELLSQLNSAKTLQQENQATYQ